MQLSITITYNNSTYTLPLTVIKSRRRTFAISIKEDGEIIVRAPLRASNRQIMQIAEEKSRWIITHYLEVPSLSFSTIFFEG